ncbi:MAG: hypothetical protein NZM10_02495, partial [Fimbriimonadales bacterium]|nr:hypothetical protein [Fimbriimonadales bacterium]
MLRKQLWILLVLSLVCACVAQPANLGEDLLLQRRITVWLKLEPMRDALRQIGKQTGVSLRCIDAIAEEKVAIFVENRPAHEILTQLAKLFRYEWRPHEAGGYILYVPDETRLQEERMVSAVREARLRALRDLAQTAREVRRMPIEEREKELEQLLAQFRSHSPQQQVRYMVLSGMTPTPLMRQTPDGEPIETGRYLFDSEYCAYHCLASLPERALNALVAGQTVGLSTKPAFGILTLPEDALLPDGMRDKQFIRRDSQSSEYVGDVVSPLRNPEFAGVWLRMASRWGMLEYQIVSLATFTENYSGERRTTRMLHRADFALSLPMANYLRENELWRFWEAWATPEAQWLEALPERVEPRTDRPAPATPSYRSEWDVEPRMGTPVDALEYLAWATRRPVISDAFRIGYVPLPRANQTALRSLVPYLTADCWVRVDESGYLLARHKYYWSYRRYELPEAWLRPLEQKSAQQGWLTLDDYIALAGKLTEAQVEYLTQARHFRIFPITQFEFEPLVSCLPALRFLASLSPAQRQQLNAGRWLLRRHLSPLQQRRFQEAIGDRFPPVQQL